VGGGRAEAAVSDRSEEAHEVYAEMVALRARIEAGELPWSALADYFTDDAVYIDSAWGRFEGRDTIMRFMDDSMAGLADWVFPEEWTMVDGDRVVSMWWNELPGARADGSKYRVPGVSILRYAGDRKFDYEFDIFNMAHIMEVLKESGWTPTGPMQPAPEQPVRDITPPLR
jgi:ketosteroid isomerase-like protein